MCFAEERLERKHSLHAIEWFSEKGEMKVSSVSRRMEDRKERNDLRSSALQQKREKSTSLEQNLPLFFVS